MSDNVVAGEMYIADVNSVFIGDYDKSNSAIKVHPSWEYSEDHLIDMKKQQAISGRLYSYKASSARGYQVTLPIDFMPNSDALQINEWWLNQTEVYFIKDSLNGASYPNINLNNTTSGDRTVAADETTKSPYTISDGDTLTINDGITETIVQLLSYYIKGRIINSEKPLSSFEFMQDDRKAGVILFRTIENNPSYSQSGG